ncbi:MAG: hypothetical protein ACFFCW_21435 [Candidatus Hodarchaeota archaeon]
MQFILLSLAVIGAILVAVGVVGTLMFMFGYKRVQIDGKNKLQFKTLRIEIVIGRTPIYSCILLGLILFIAPFFYFQYVQFAAVRELELETIPRKKLETGGYALSEQEIWFDLRKRKTVRSKDEDSVTELQVKVKIKDVEKGVKEVNFLEATSIDAIKPIEMPEGARWRRATEESKEVVNPFIDQLNETEAFVNGFFHSLLARKGRMKTYSMTVPIADGKNEQISYTLQFLNAFQGIHFEWAGRFVSADTDILKMHILFPESKPFESYESYKRAPDSKEKTKINNPDIKTDSGNHRLTWKIYNAKKGEEYTIKWNW